MRAAVLEGDDRTWDHTLLTDRWMIGSRDDDRLFLECENLLERLVGDGLGNQCGVELARKNCSTELRWVSRAQLQNDVGIKPVILGERSGKPDSRRTVHGAKTENAARARVLYRHARLIG